MKLTKLLALLLAVLMVVAGFAACNNAPSTPLSLIHISSPGRPAQPRRLPEPLPLALCEFPPKGEPLLQIHEKSPPFTQI